MKVDKFIVLSLTLLLLAAMVAAGCSAQDKTAAVATYPTKPITMIVPFAAGGSTDMIARAMEKVAPRHLGQSLVIKNLPGGAGTIGLNELAGTSPDGYTLGVVSVGAILQPLYGETRYHYPTALEPLVQITAIPTVAVVRADQPWEDMRDLVEYAKQHPGEIKYGHPGLGTGNHVAAEMVALKSEAAMEQVPFRGDSEILAALLGGHIKLMFTHPPAIKEHVKSGKVKVLGINTPERSTDPVLSNIKTFKEQGIDMTFGIWQGIAAPKGLSAAEKKKLADGLRAIVNDPEFQKNMEGLGMTVNYLDSQAFSNKWMEENTELTKVVKDTGIVDKIAAQKK